MVLKFILIILIASVNISVQFKDIVTILEEFELHNLHMIWSLDDFNLPLIKTLFKIGRAVTIESNTHVDDTLRIGNVTTNTIIYLNSQTNISENFQLDLTSIGQEKTIILISQDVQFEKLLNIVALKTEINQHVFVFNKNTQELHEAYTINSIVIKKKLGGIDLITNNFSWLNDVSPKFIDRRSNLHGTVLKGMVEFTGLYMNADLTYLKKAKYFPNNETYRITGFTYGLFNDILEIMQERLNFTTELYKRKEVGWGYIYPKSNGSYEGTGIIGDIFFRRADIAVAPLYYTIDRALYVNYLPPVTSYFAAIYIPKTNTEIVDFDTYIAPFKHLLWISLTFLTVSFVIIKIFFLKIHVHNIKLFGGGLEFEHFWTSFTGFFGGKPSPTPIDSISSYKIAIVSKLLCGTVVWIAYRAGLTAELSVNNPKYPFTDMESFSKTNWRLLSGSIDDASSVIFSRASSTNVFNKVFRNNMDENSFNGDNQRQIDLIMSQSETAYFISTGMVRNSYEYKSCKIEEAWKYKIGSYAIPMTRGLPYEIFMRNVMSEIYERGQLYQLQNRWKIPKPQCNSLYSRGNPLSLKKLASIFIIGMIGISFAMIIFFIEKLFNKSQLNLEHSKNEKEADKAKLYEYLVKFMIAVNNDDIIDDSKILKLNQEIENYNKLRVTM